jgi:hypothetical protein
MSKPLPPLNEEVPKTLQKMIDTFKERNKTYGDNYLAVGQMMAAMFPEGITLHTPEDFVKFHWLDWTVGKLSRYARAGLKHGDSTLDAAVYLTMIHAWDKLAEQSKGAKDLP